MILCVYVLLFYSQRVSVIYIYIYIYTFCVFLTLRWLGIQHILVVTYIWPHTHTDTQIYFYSTYGYGEIEIFVYIYIYIYRERGWGREGVRHAIYICACEVFGVLEMKKKISGGKREKKMCFFILLKNLLINIFFSFCKNRPDIIWRMSDTFAAGYLNVRKISIYSSPCFLPRLHRKKMLNSSIKSHD